MQSGGIPAEDAKNYYGEATIIQGPIKLVLISVKSGINNRNKMLERIDQLLEKKEEAHQYIGNYDSTVRFHYGSESAKADIISEKGRKNSDQQLSDDYGHNRRYDHFLYDVSDGIKGNYFTRKIS